MNNTRVRLDLLLVERKLAPTRSQARDLIRRGCVLIAGTAALKAGQEIDPTIELALTPGARPYVSRAGIKLAAAIEAFGLNVSDRTALDVGASTGGFTDALLKAGARRVFAVDVGSGQLDPGLAADPRVVDLQGLDARALLPAHVPEPVDIIVADVSFISLTQALPIPLTFAAPAAWLIALVKPQFEAGREAVGRGGIVRNEADRARAMARVRDFLGEQDGWRITGEIASPITGADGNRELLLGARRDG